MVTGLARRTDLHLANEGRTKTVLRSSVTPPAANAVPLLACTAAPASDAHAFYLYNFVTFILIRPWNIGSPHKRLLGLPLLTNASMWVRNPPTTGAATIKNNHITAPQKNRHARSHRFIGFHNSLPSGSEFPNLERCDENLAGIVARRDCWM